MRDDSRNIRACTACVLSRGPRPANGKWPCPITGRPFLDHIAQQACPLGKFRFGLGDAVEWMLRKTRIGPVFKRAIEDINAIKAYQDGTPAKKCGCASRQRRANTRLSLRIPAKRCS